MDKTYFESDSEFSFNFGGENYIYADTLSKTIENVIEALQTVTVNQEPNAYFKLRISTFKTGSFIITLQAIIGYIPNLINGANVEIAKQVIDTFLSVLNIKKLLKGNKPKEIKYSEEIATIKTLNGEELKVPTDAAKLYFSNNKMDNAIINIFNYINNDDSRSHVRISRDGEDKITIEKDEFKNMSVPIVSGNDNINKTWGETINTNLLLRKPDLMGNSKWGFYFNKNIDATISDEAWLEEVHSGRIKAFYQGVRVPVKLLIEFDIDKSNIPIKDSERYTVLEVTGDIIEPQDNQLAI